MDTFGKHISPVLRWDWVAIARLENRTRGHPIDYFYVVVS